MVCQAASATTLLRDALKAGPLCPQRILGLRKISAMPLNSTRSGRGTSLIMYLGAVVMPKCSSRVQSLPVGTSSHTPCRSGEVALCQPCPLSHGPPVAAAPQQVSPEPLGSQGPPTLSQKVPAPVMHAEARRAVTPRAMAHFEVPADQRVDGRCSCMRCGKCEPSII
jgi:hypothetical protein